MRGGCAVAEHVRKDQNFHTNSTMFNVIFDGSSDTHQIKKFAEICLYNFNGIQNSNELLRCFFTSDRTWIRKEKKRRLRQMS